MRPTTVLVAFLAVVGAALGLAVAYTGKAPARAAGKPRVRLAVLVVFDQLRGDYLDKWRPLFGPDGFARLQRDGVWFSNCHYPYGTTTTGPGHASMLSGTSGDRHGIINNEWFERGASAYCAGSSRYELVPAVPKPQPGKDGKVPARSVGNPDRLLAETVADVLKDTHPKSRVFGVSLKDRSAILPTGKRPDGAFWFSGRFVTSTYYADHLPAWVTSFNKARAADRWFGKDWTRFRSDVDYATWCDPDISDGEGKGATVKEKTDPAFGWSQGVAFPHSNTAGRAKPSGTYYEALANSPFGNDLLLEFTKSCVEAERLGRDDAPDLLVVSFSSNDLIGHTWGPDSQEVLDVTLRSDALMADLLHFLDAKVGDGQYLLAVTADHGICPTVQSSVRRGRDAKRVEPTAIQTELEKHLTTKFPTPKAKDPKATKRPAWIESVSFPWVYLNPGTAKSAGKTVPEVAAEASAFLKTHPAVARALTRADFEAGFLPEDVIGTRQKRSYHPARSGDVCVVLKEWYLPGKSGDPGTTHGSPYTYDTHVPLLVYGPGISGGARDEPTTPQAAAAIFARWLDLRLPNKAEFPLPKSLEDPQ